MDTLINELTAFLPRLMAGDKQSVLLLCSVYCLVVLGYSVIYQCRIRRWPSTTGKLANLGAAVFGSDRLRSDRNYKLDALYQYEVDGQSYAGKRVSTWVVVASHNVKGLLHFQARGVESDGEGQVRVYYHPHRPAKSFLIRPGLPGIVMVTLGAVVPLSLYGYHYL